MFCGVYAIRKLKCNNMSILPYLETSTSSSVQWYFLFPQGRQGALGARGPPGETGSKVLTSEIFLSTCL